MYERYTESARLVIYYARDEALIRGADAIEPGDIVLALAHLAPHPGSLFEILQRNAAELRTILGSGPAIYGPPARREIPLSNIAKRALAFAAIEGRRDHRYAIDREHLLRGVLRADGVTASKLARSGYTLSAMRRASRKAHQLTPDSVAPPGWKPRSISRWWGLLSAAILLLT